MLGYYDLVNGNKLNDLLKAADPLFICSKLRLAERPRLISKKRVDLKFLLK
jgi:hypothetical protein